MLAALAEDGRRRERNRVGLLARSDGPRENALLVRDRRQDRGGVTPGREPWCPCLRREARRERVCAIRNA